MVDVNRRPERTWTDNAFERPTIQIVLNPEVERLCRAWAEVARAILTRRRQGDR